MKAGRADMRGVSAGCRKGAKGRYEGEARIFEIMALTVMTDATNTT